MGRNQDADAVERKLYPIYDALDSRNPKGAMKLLDAALKKHADSQILRVLKGVALERLGRTQEALEVCDEVRREKPTDDHVLGTLTIVYKTLGRASDVAAAYEAASAAQPGNLDLLDGLFGAYIRAFDYVKQQQVAMKLWKALDKDEYLYSAVTSLLLQAREGNIRMIQLAEAMLAKKSGSGGKGLASYEALLVYLDVLGQQGKHAAALELLEGPVGDALMSMKEEKLKMIADVYARLGKRGDAARLYEEVLLDNPDDYSALLGFLDAVLPRSAEPSVSGRKPSGSAVDVAKAFAALSLDDVGGASGEVEALARADLLAIRLPEVAAASPFPLRGAGLAAVEVALRRLRLERISGDAGGGANKGLAEAILGYWRGHGHLASCSLDLRPYTRALTARDAATWLAEKMKSEFAEVTGAEEDRKRAAQSLRRHVAALQVEHDLGLVDSSLVKAGSAGQRASELLDLYVRTLPLSYPGLDEREKGPGDDLVTLAASALVHGISGSTEQNPQGGALSNTIQAVSALEIGLKSSPYNASMRLALTSLYGLLGCPAAAQRCFVKLECKHIQLDTLVGQHLLPALLACGPTSTVRATCEEAERMFSDHDRHAGETLYVAHANGTCSKVIEFVAFKERLSRSHTRFLARVEGGLARLRNLLPSAPPAEFRLLLGEVCAALPAGEVTAEALGQMRFNEDLNTRAWWHPPPEGAWHTAVCDWWERSRHSLEGQDLHALVHSVWWEGSEALTPLAEERRARWRAHLLRRWLTPHLLAAAAGLAAHADSPGTRELISSFVVSAGGDDALAWVRAAGVEPWGAADAGVGAVGCALEALLAALALVGAEVAAMHDGATSLAALEEAAALCGDVFKRTCGAVASWLDGAEAGGGTMCGGLLAASASVAYEGALPAALVLSCWGEALRAKRKQKKKDENTAGAHQGARAALEALQVDVAAGVGCLRESVARHVDGACGGAETLAAKLEAHATSGAGAAAADTSVWSSAAESHWEALRAVHSALGAQQKALAEVALG